MMIGEPPGSSSRSLKPSMRSALKPAKLSASSTISAANLSSGDVERLPNSQLIRRLPYTENVQAASLLGGQETPRAPNDQSLAQAHLSAHSNPALRPLRRPDARRGVLARRAHPSLLRLPCR